MRYRWFAFLLLLVALAGGATFLILQPVLAPAAAPIQTNALAATPAATPTPMPTPMPTPTPLVHVLKARTSANDFQAGVMILVWGNDPNFVTNIRLKLDYLARIGVNSVGMVFPIFQTNARSTDVHADANGTPSAEQITAFIREARQRGFTVMLRPLLEEGNLATSGDWRGSIHPQPVDAWFRAYGDLMVSYASLAEANGAEVFDVGTEFNTLEPYGPQWLDVIKRIRQGYTGQLTYSSVSGNGYPTQFFRALDFLSIDAYYGLDASAGATVEQLQQAWEPGVAQVKRIATDSGLPVVITEVGLAARREAFRAPSSSNPAFPLDLEAQRSYYAASCNALGETVRGLYWWYMSPYIPPAPLTDPGFDPTGKPAEAEIAVCFRGLSSRALARGATP
jgi:hypothetical protein